MLIQDLVLCKRKLQFPLGFNQNAWQELSPLPRIPALSDTFNRCACSFAHVRTSFLFTRILRCLCDGQRVCVCARVIEHHGPPWCVHKTLRKKNMLQSHAPCGLGQLHTFFYINHQPCGSPPYTQQCKDVFRGPVLSQGLWKCFWLPPFRKTALFIIRAHVLLNSIYFSKKNFSKHILPLCFGFQVLHTQFVL